jgi:alpha-beta hydrolase superfamily lysophospholipase
VDYGQSFTVPAPMHPCGVVCDDGVELIGLVTAPVVSGDPPAVIAFVPGQYDNAYQNRLGHALAAVADVAGIGCLLTNTRGRDSFGYERRYRDERGGFHWDLLGSSFERVADAGYDLAAWLSYVEDLAPDAPVVLAGHSHGAIKVANHLINADARNEDRIAAVALLSPSDDIGDQRVTLRDRYGEALEWATERVDRGEPRALMPAWAYPSRMSAGTYREAFGPGSPLWTFAFHDPARATLADPASIWPQPTLVVFGAEDVATGPLSSADAAATTAEWFAARGRLDTLVVDGANHEYEGHEDSVARSVVEWVSQLSTSAASRSGGKTG